MSWLFSRALVEEFSAATCSAGEPSAQLSVMPSQHKFWRNDKTMEPSDLSRFGLTCEVLTDARGQELLTWYRAAFPARTSALPVRAWGWMGLGLVCGSRWPESLTKFDLGTSTWKTPQLSLLEDSDEFLETWPRWGSMRNGECWQRVTWAPNTSENASGFWPTPNVPNGGRSVAHVTDWRGPTTAYHNGKKVQVGLESAVRMWPTPTVNGNANKPGASPTSGWGLRSAVNLWTTPTADDTGHRREKYAQGGTALSTQAGGPLNPTWVEWLMGWPIGWTDLRPLAMDKFREWQQQHTPRSPLNFSEAKPDAEAAIARA